MIGLGRSAAEAEAEDGASAASDEDNDSLLDFPVSVVALVTVGWLLICAAAFRSWEDDWDFATSLYFAFISFSTIGWAFLSSLPPTEGAL